MLVVLILAIQHQYWLGVDLVKLNDNDLNQLLINILCLWVVDICYLNIVAKEDVSSGTRFRIHNILSLKKLECIMYN